MSRQDKATTDRNSKILRELVKRTENKVCADCKRNDPRWASWNLGVFLCIRCSGIHRSMGTHISKVKSVDLDIWTPEQMESIQKWGNARANLYWEAHLKPGHIPPEHKMEAFIRSKYESRRWVMEGPPPADPSVLEGAREHYSENPPAPEPATIVQTQARQAIPPPNQSRQPVQSQPRPLLSSQVASKSAAPIPAPTATSAPVPAPAAAPVTSVKDDLFSLDFHQPPQQQQAQPAASQKDFKSNILSLYNSGPAPGTGVLGGGLAGFGAASAQPTASQTTSMVGNGGTAMWGAQSGWNVPTAAAANPWGQPAPAQNNIWVQPQPQQQQAVDAYGGAPQQQASSFGSQNVWTGSTQTTSASGDLFGAFATPAPATQPAAKKDDAFGDLWGGFK
ncbi:hypothetical protein M422DRAFT_30074 [Sphaerobolus stellatus SS14]|uniref:Arf-GAP domain-containing protein n=1 Tax=Sphaerobolus stellatus (strain SS14) TaxID=990650 RepID=A0A0C9W2G3_SPHS4|nr:hypothetical protein M422DRAFT_30074 [Sphaerobolus stellatus SS14]